MSNPPRCRRTNQRHQHCPRGGPAPFLLHAVEAAAAASSDPRAPEAPQSNRFVRDKPYMMHERRAPACPTPPSTPSLLPPPPAHNRWVAGSRTPVPGGPTGAGATRSARSPRRGRASTRGNGGIVPTMKALYPPLESGVRTGVHTQYREGGPRVRQRPSAWQPLATMDAQRYNRGVPNG